MTENFIAASYRYLRLAVLVVVAMLFTSLVLERWVEDCRLGSISAYYYTPVHSVFIGALITLGVVMIAIKGSDALEDLALNIAGGLAPIVAFVPTSRPSSVCDPDAVVVDAQALVRNNIPSMGVGLILALGLALVVAWRQGRIARPPRSTWIGIAISAVLIAAGLVWYFADTDSFLSHAHESTAIAMFVFIWVAVLANSGWPGALLKRVHRWLGATPPASIDTPSAHHLRFRGWYRAISLAMPIAAVAVVAFIRTDTVFWLEVAEITPFAVFWALQTAEGWDEGVANPS